MIWTGGRNVITCLNIFDEKARIQKDKIHE